MRDMNAATAYYRVITTKTRAARRARRAGLLHLAAAKYQEAQAIADQARAEGINPLDGR